MAKILGQKRVEDFAPLFLFDQIPVTYLSCINIRIFNCLPNKEYFNF